MIDYKDKFSFIDRANKSISIRTAHENYVPVIMQKFAASNVNVPDLKKQKYLIKSTDKFSLLFNTVRSNLKLPKDKALFFYVNNKIINQNDLMSEVDNKHSDADGFLYVYYTLESTFGNKLAPFNQ
jgi:GABA(A) receptor-associated protein